MAEADSKFKELLSVTSLVAFVNREVSLDVVTVEELVILLELELELILVFVVLVMLLEFVLEGRILSSKIFKVFALLDHTYNESSVANTEEA